MPPVPKDLLTDLLRDVSRSFYLTLRILPAQVRPQIGLAYLLARATDTIADTSILPLAERLEALDQLRARILGTSSARLDFERFQRVSELGGGPPKVTCDDGVGTGRQATAAPSGPEHILLGRIEEALGILGRFAAADQQLIREALSTITSGQALDLTRFAGATEERIVALGNDAELDDYTYRVAGCVGEFWTKICRSHLFPEAALDEVALLANGVRFGQGLQLVNILRDLPRDLRMGRCYLPLDRLSEAGLQPSDLLRPEVEPRLRRLYHSYLDRAEAALAAGWAYTTSLPWRCARVRLASAWPVLIGMKTLAELRAANVLEVARRVKIERHEVWGIVVRSVLTYPVPQIWRRLFKPNSSSPMKRVASQSVLE